MTLSMSMLKDNNLCDSLVINVLTVSDTRTFQNDTSGDYLCDVIQDAGHKIGERIIVLDNIYQIRAALSNWIADKGISAILITGGTGFSGRDSTPEAVKPLFDKDIDGFGDIFRYLSHGEIGSSTIQSRALAGVANNTTIFCIPGSTGACKLAWNELIKEQLDSSHQPCNFVGAFRSKD